MKFAVLVPAFQSKALFSVLRICACKNRFLLRLSQTSSARADHSLLRMGLQVSRCHKALPSTSTYGDHSALPKLLLHCLHIRLNNKEEVAHDPARFRHPPYRASQICRSPEEEHGLPGCVPQLGTNSVAHLLYCRTHPILAAVHITCASGGLIGWTGFAELYGILARFLLLWSVRFARATFKYRSQPLSSLAASFGTHIQPYSDHHRK